MKKSGIYKITCTENGHFYIGRTIDYTKRIGQHKVDLKSGTHKNQRMQHCYNKYGAASFAFELITEAGEGVDLISEEQNLLDIHIGDERCMNINRSAKVFCDVPFTDERRRKIGDSRRRQVGKQKRTPEQRKHISDALMGHRLSDETKKKISEARKGQKLDNSTIDKLKTKFSGRGNPMYGRTGSDHPHSIPVWQIDPTTGEKLQRFESAKDAASAMGAKDGSNLRKAIKEQRKAYGYFWQEDGTGQQTIESTAESVNE